MTNDFIEILGDFKEYVKKIGYYDNALSLLHWDLTTGIPEDGIPARAEVIGLLSTESFKMTTADKMKNYLAYFNDENRNNNLDQIMKAVVRECQKDFDRFNKIPEDKYRAYVELTSQAESVWKKAKQTNDFSLFSPYLERIINYNLEILELWGYQDNKYNTLLDFYEPGMTVEKLDQIFADLKEKIISLLKRIENTTEKPLNKIAEQHFNINKQKEISIKLLKEIGFNFKAGRLDESEHPFTIGITPGDVRITTHYYPENLASALFSSLHEGGHGIYEQNIDDKLIGTPLCTGSSTGIHESQSRFWENIIGRSYPFWEKYYPQLRELYPEQLTDISLSDFYKSINLVTPSLIRTEADELTYNLHIIIRYEIEKALINQQISVSELPAIWRQKMKDYLGIEPDTDSDGVLQDVHWSNGLIGYFPSYTLGNIYAAQFYYTIKKEICEFDQLIVNGQLNKISSWLNENIHQYGKLLSPGEIIRNVTGEESNSKYLIKYLEDKYTEIYQL